MAYTKLYLSMSLLLLGLLSSCSDVLMDSINLVGRDPIISTPTILSARESGKIFLSWDKDAGADEYALLEKPSLTAPSVEIYRGIATSFIDTAAVNDNSYFYALVKRKGGKWFPASNYVLGFSSDKLADSFEPNESPQTAVPFSIYQLSTLSFYTNSNALLQDHDYFYVDVAPRTEYQITIAPKNAYPADLNLYYKIGNADEIQVIGTDTIKIDNATVQSGRFYFSVYVNAPSQPLSATYGKTVSYELTFKQTTFLGTP